VRPTSAESRSSLALAFMLALSIAVASALAFSSRNSRTADYSKEAVRPSISPRQG
jgi:hypothetical protein